MRQIRPIYTIPTYDSPVAGNSCFPSQGMVDTSDAVLIERSRSGDHDAFAGIVTRYENDVFQLVWRILRGREDAEDAAQETFLRAWRSLSQFDVSRKFRPWLLRIAANAALSAAHRRRAVPETQEHGILETISAAADRAPDACAARRETLELVQSLVDQMPPESAALFQLRFGQDLSIGDISVILNKKPGAVAVALHRMRKRFRRLIFGSGFET